MPTSFHRLRSDLDATRLDPHGPGHPGRAPHDLCWSLYRAMPWLGLSQEWRRAARPAFAFALSVCQMPKPAGSLGALLDRAFPAGSLPSDESSLFRSVSAASGLLLRSSFYFLDGTGLRACELAPIFFGGLAWLHDPVLASASRLIFSQALADACASRVFFDARAWDPPPTGGMEAFAQALVFCSRLPWPGADALGALSRQRLGEGCAGQWSAALAARCKMALSEGSEIASACPGAPSDQAGRRL